LHLVDDTRSTPPNGVYAGTTNRKLDVEVWYPSTLPPAPTSVRDAPLDTSGARYPLIVHGHALQDNRLGESYLTEHLASRGYIVAAVDFPLGKLGAPGGATSADIGNQPGDLSFVIDRLLAGDGGFAGAIDADRIGASGFSLGGGTVLLLTYQSQLRDPRIRAVLPIAPAFSCAFTRLFYRSTRVPMLVLQGDEDRLAPLAQNGLRVVWNARGRQILAVLRGASHLGFLGIASFLGTPATIDDFGCAGLAGEQFPALPSDGIDSAACSPPCQTPATATLDFDRQHQLTQIVAAAFFDASLGEDQSAGCWLRRGLKVENPDVKTRRH
jgi:predicted dienelactone hydrolase